VTLPYGMDKTTRSGSITTPGTKRPRFSHPIQGDNVARWMLALWDVTGKAEYKDRAEEVVHVPQGPDAAPGGWHLQDLNYWQPPGRGLQEGRLDQACPMGHPKALYYEIDLDGIVDAYEHGLVFTKADIDRLIDTAKTSWCDGEPGSLGPAWRHPSPVRNGEVDQRLLPETPRPPSRSPRGAAP